jgi:ribosomal-protein-alanine N-acetyltransferase
MEEKDLVYVLEIENFSFSNPWRLSTFVGEINNYPISIPYVVVFRPDERVIGYIILWFIQEKVQISNFAIHPEFRRLGVGEAVLRYILAKIKREGARKVFLEVRPSNRAALSLYERMGFQILGVRKGYYRSPVEDALIMGRSIDQ